MSEQSERVDRAVAHLLLHHPWWASLFLNLRRRYTDTLPTMATDGTWLLINENFVSTLTDKEIEVILAHEVGHCALLHPFRRGSRDPLIWNIAADQAVNALLEADGFILPEGAVPPGPLNKTVEELYEHLPKYKVLMLDVIDAGLLEEEKSQVIKPLSADDWRQAVSASCGIMPATIKRSVSDAQRCKRDWKSELNIWISNTIKSSEKTWMRPSRRYFPAPGNRRDPQTKIAICVDTSGSVTNVLLDNFAAEMRAICSIQGIEAHVIACDAGVTAIYRPGEQWHDLPGGGGTDFQPAIHKASELEVDGAVYLTDGHGEFGEDPGWPVIWAISTTVIAPWGQTIHIEGD